MSESKGQRVVVSLDALVAQMAELRKYIENLQTQINQIQEEISELRASSNALSEFKSGKTEEILTPADRRGHILIKAKPVSKETVVTHIGLEYYVELPLDKAIEILTLKEKELREASDELQRELVRVLNYYQRLENVVNTVLTQARQQAKQTSEKISS
ncbi:MAG: prefoldin subunit alpha [Zestosphaera tikiterensis]|uniref:Prefoldin subunit alpha n=1 Tax=Zestosphaera tikiterensis TaxID=1973259 RepID=A0A2R7Y772_9CREN|nr:MAG: prefoldin subunit alpha [Zestosphaera tikiterensis]